MKSGPTEKRMCRKSVYDETGQQRVFDLFRRETGTLAVEVKMGKCKYYVPFEELALLANELQREATKSGAQA